MATHSPSPITDGPQAAVPSYFLSVTLQDVRCFGTTPQTLELTDETGRPSQWTILLGNNGTGKTTVLQALAGMEPVPATRYAEDALSRIGFIQLGSAINLIRDGAASARVSAMVNHGVGLNGTLRATRHEEFELFFGTDHGIQSSGDWANFPICFGYGAARRIGESDVLSPERFRDDAIATLFSDAAPLRNAEEWLLQLDYAASKRSARRPERLHRRDQVRSLLLHILPEVTDIRFSELGEGRFLPTVKFLTPYGWVPLRQLGYGYQTLIAWMVDLASRMVERYPNSEDPLAEPAVVLVDEIDLHMHPTWQRKVMSYLSERFPNTQFIATAHSPLIVQGASAVGANLAVLKREGDHVVIHNDVDEIRGWRIDQILTSDLFAVESARPPQYDAMLAERKQILSKPKLTKRDQQRLAQLDRDIGTLPAGETADDARRMLDLAEETMQLIKEQRASQP